MKITYEEIEPYLLDYVQNLDIPEEIDYRIKAYLQKNPDFQKELDELKETADFLKEMPLASPSPQVSIGFYAMLAQEQNKVATVAKPIAQTPPSSPTSRPNAMRKWGAMVGVACLLLVGFGISWQMMSKESNQMAMETSFKKNAENNNPTTTQTEETPEKIQDKNENNEEIKTKEEAPTQNFNKNEQGMASVERRNESVERKNKELVNNDAENKNLKLSSPITNARIANTQRKRANNKFVPKQEDAEMQEGISSNFSTYNNRNIEVSKSMAIMGESDAGMEPEDKASISVKQLSTSEKLAKINEAQASAGELLQLLENDQNMHIKLWAMQALEQQLKNTPDNQITEKVIALFPTHKHIALQLATLDWIAKYNPTNKKSIIDTLLKNDKISPIVKKQAEKLKR